MSKNITIIIIILLVIVVSIGIVVWNMQPSYVVPPTNEPTVTPPTGKVAPTDSSAVIDESLKSIDVGELDKEFREIDAGLNSL